MLYQDTNEDLKQFLIFPLKRNEKRNLIRIFIEPVPEDFLMSTSHW